MGWIVWDVGGQRVWVCGGTGERRGGAIAAGMASRVFQMGSPARGPRREPCGAVLTGRVDTARVVDR
jgi:hypothetical protein